MGKVEDRLAELGIRLPDVPAPLGSYKPVSKSGNLIFISGQLPIVGGQLLHKGKVEKDVSIEEATEAARACSINALAVLKKELESLDAVRQILKLTGYVSSSQGFGKQANVINGASDLFFQVFGEAGRHSRAAVGVSELPMDSPVEVEVIAEVV